MRPSGPRASGRPRAFTLTEQRVTALLVRLTAAGLPARVAAPLARAAVAEAQAARAPGILDSPEEVAVELGPGLCLMVVVVA